MMNNSAGQQQREQVGMPDFDFGEYIPNATGNGTQHQHSLDIYSDFSQHRNHSQMNLDSNITTQNLLGSQSRMDTLSQGQPQNVMSAEMLSLKGRLEQQMKLQQLQQLILQHQVRQSICHSSCIPIDTCLD